MKTNLIQKYIYIYIYVYIYIHYFDIFRSSEVLSTQGNIELKEEQCESERLRVEEMVVNLTNSVRASENEVNSNN